MLDLLETMPELQEDERTIVSTRVFAVPRKMRNQFGSRELRDENVRTYGSVQGSRDLFVRLERHLAKASTAGTR